MSFLLVLVVVLPCAAALAQDKDVATLQQEDMLKVWTSLEKLEAK